MLIRSLWVFFLCAFTNFACADDFLKSYLPETCYQTGEFEQQKPLGTTNKLLTTKGRFAFACDKGLVWHVESPLVETTLYQLNGRQWIKPADSEMQPLNGKVHLQIGKILNQLIGGNQDYLNKNFVSVNKDNQLELTPRQRRMKKFLHSILIIRDSEQVNIKMLQQNNGFTAVRIYNIQNRSSLNETECRESTNTSRDVCQVLFGS